MMLLRPFCLYQTILHQKSTHVRDAIDLKRTMFMVIVALIPCLLFGMWNVGYQYHLAIGETVGLFDNFIFGFWKFLPLIIVSGVVGLLLNLFSLFIEVTL